MTEILTKAGSYIAIILLGIFLRRIGVFKKEDFGVLAKIVLRITLPAAIITNAAGRVITPGMLAISALGFLGGGIYMVLGWLLNRRGGRDRQAFGILNYPGYNIGNFALPFTQGFLGAGGAFATGLFDVGNAFVCLGSSYGVASAIKQGGRLDMRPVLKALGRSVPFLVYVLTTVLGLLRIQLPEPVVACAGIIANANAFLAMLMIGVGFHLEASRSQLGQVAKVLAVRYSVAAMLALIYYFLLPFDLETRQALVILAFSPISSATPGFTADLGEDVGLSSAINSFSIIFSIVIIVTLLIVML